MSAVCEWLFKWVLPRLPTIRCHCRFNRLHFTLTTPTPEALAGIHARTSTFILITNLHEEEWGNADLLREYKGRSTVETRFRNLKARPCIVDNIYVKSSRRAEALAYLFLLALIVASLIEIRIRQELKERNAEFTVPGNDGQIARP